MASETLSLTCSQSGRRGRRIARDTVARLLAAGGGFCYRPHCPTGFLWHELEDGSAVKLAQVAHIVAASTQGPRGDPDAAETRLTSIGNLVLLCPTCHVIVDGAPEQFTVEVIEDWKRNHEGRVTAALGVRRFSTPDDLRDEVEALLLENRTLWELYGPDSEAARTLSPDAPAAWRREVIRTVIPNNSHLLRLLDENKRLLNAQDQRAVAQFRVHAVALEDRHLGGITNTSAPRFPNEMNSLLMRKD